MRRLFFDTELAWTPALDTFAGGDIWTCRPFNISVAATYCEPDKALDLWYGGTVDDPAQEMNGYTVFQMFEHIQERQADGMDIFTWNGNFDFRLLSNLLPFNRTEVVGVFLKSFDPMFQMFMQRGFPVSANAAAKGFGLPLKPMLGGDAPRLWRDGCHQQVMDYVTYDVTTLAQIVKGIQVEHGLRWVKKTGGIGFEPFERLLTVEQCLNMPDPDNSWMDKPLKKEDFILWLETESY